nr:hypothetical protein GCM10017745_68520 [Saccharothrix mutabilis subsp. capreolus]
MDVLVTGGCGGSFGEVTAVFSRTRASRWGRFGAGGRGTGRGAGGRGRGAGGSDRATPPNPHIAAAARLIASRMRQ